MVISAEKQSHFRGGTSYYILMKDICALMYHSQKRPETFINKVKWGQFWFHGESIAQESELSFSSAFVLQSQKHVGITHQGKIWFYAMSCAPPAGQWE